MAPSTNQLGPSQYLLSNQTGGFEATAMATELAATMAMVRSSGRTPQWMRAGEAAHPISEPDGVPDVCYADAEEVQGHPAGEPKNGNQ